MKKLTITLCVVLCHLTILAQEDSLYTEKITLIRNMNIGEAMDFDDTYGIRGNTLGGKVSVRVYAITPMEIASTPLSEYEGESQGLLAEEDEEFIGIPTEEWGLIDHFFSAGEPLTLSYVASSEAVPSEEENNSDERWSLWGAAEDFFYNKLISFWNNNPETSRGSSTVPHATPSGQVSLRNSSQMVLSSFPNLSHFKEKILAAFAYKSHVNPQDVVPSDLIDQYIRIKIVIERTHNIPIDQIREINVHGEIITEEELIQSEQIFVYGNSLSIIQVDSAPGIQQNPNDNPFINSRFTDKGIFPDSLVSVKINAQEINTEDHYFYLAAKSPPDSLNEYFYDDLGRYFTKNDSTFNLYRIKLAKWNGSIGGINGPYLIGNNLTLVQTDFDLHVTPHVVYSVTDSYFDISADLYADFSLANNTAHDSIHLKNVKIIFDPNEESDLIFGPQYPDTTILNGSPLTTSSPLLLLEDADIYLGHSESAKIYMTYDASPDPENVPYKNVRVDWPFYRFHDQNELTTYNIEKEMYHNIPVYKVAGGMSMEYTVQKSIAALTRGISHTWAVDSTTDETGNTVPDLDQGPPLPVWGDVDFLDKSVKKTIELYNEHLDQGDINTVIIAPGVANVPYVSMAMQAPVLPLHFLVTTERISDVKAILDHANSTGYEAFATSGYDPSMPGLGVSWIKLLKLPQEYINFLTERNVQDVIIIGAQDKDALGETEGARILFADTDVTLVSGDYQPGDVYVMTHGGEEGELRREAGFSDYTSLRDNGRIFDQASILDWEASVADIQILNFSNDIKSMNPAPSVYSITAVETLDLYQMATHVMHSLFKKNLGTQHLLATRIDLNEYLIGYPGYELYQRHLPYLYWQMTPIEYLQENLNTYLEGIYRNSSGGPISRDSIMQHIPVHINAKHPARKGIRQGLEDGGFSTVTINNWLKADVWDLSDGINAPCEIAAESIKTLGYSNYENVLKNLSYLTIQDFINLANLTSPSQAYSRFGGHPEPNASKKVIHLTSDNGVTIKEDFYEPSPYWQSAKIRTKVELKKLSGFQPESLGYIGVNSLGNERFQRVIITEFDLNNEYTNLDLDIGYRFNTSPENTNNTYPSSAYDSTLGNQQKMACYEWVKVPKNEWMDIPNRVMEREGALVIWNGTVYDADYNGIPGVVPFIKMEDPNPNHSGQSLIKAKPDILSYKGEAYFAWNWGINKSVRMGPRPKEVGPSDINNLFINETTGYANAISGMTYMSNVHASSKILDIERYQPDWMLEYTEFPNYLLGPSGTSIRCYTAGGSFGNQCTQYIAKNGLARPEEGFNNCNSLLDTAMVKKISTLAYRQHEKLFNQVPNARTYIALTADESKLHIGLIDGDLGQFNAKGPILTKTMGMHNWEVGNFVQHKAYKHFMHMDGGSSSQMWISGMGPLHDPDGYPLDADNQGPYNSRLVSSYLMIKPKINPANFQNILVNRHHKVMDNTGIDFDYAETERLKKKSYISLSPTMDLLKGDGYGSLMMNFKIDGIPGTEGAVLFSMGEDMYYPDTEGLKTVVPETRNLMVLGIGQMPQTLVEYLNKVKDKGAFHGSFSTQAEYSLYYVAVRNGVIAKVIFETGSNDKWIDGNWHAIELRNTSNSDEPFSIAIDNELMQVDEYYGNGGLFDFTTEDPINYAYLGAVNCDGRFVTGNAKLHIDNVVFVVGSNAISDMTLHSLMLSQLYSDLKTTARNISPDFNLTNSLEGIYIMQFEENTNPAYHSFSLSNDENKYKSKTRLYGVNLNTHTTVHNPAPNARVAESDDEILPELEQSKPGSVLIYPNETNEKLDIEFVTEKEEPVSFSIISIEGKQIHHEVMQASEGLNQKAFKFNRGIPGGIYIVKINSESIDNTSRVILNRD